MLRFILAMMGLAIGLVSPFLFISSAHGQQSPHIAATDAKTPAAELRGFRLPPGFKMQLVASEPQIKNPINIAFDDRGRLWVTMSSEYPFPAGQGMTKDTVKILEDFGPDGRARKITTFADNLNIPIGVLPYKNGAFVFSIPNVWFLEDSDGDGKADKKRIILKEYGYRDTHGMTGEFQMGFDGWIYACHGFSNTSVVEASDGSKITMQSGNTYRFKPDGSHVEQFTFGQVNPFGLAFDPWGNLFSCDCHTRPIYQLLRGAYYPSFGKPHDGIGFGPEMMTHSHGSTAIAGITYYAAKQFPKEYRDRLYIGNVVTNRINCDTLQDKGSTLLAKEQPDFVVSDDPWFRPVDIKLGPDGALYVADFYNRIIGHYEVPLNHPDRDRDHGRIWRIYYAGDGRDDLSKAPNLAEHNLENLLSALGSMNLTVRMQAGNCLVTDHPKEAVEFLDQHFSKIKNPEQKVQALWVLQRLNKLSDGRWQNAAKDDSALVRTHAMRIAAEKSEWTPSLRQIVTNSLADRNAFVQRAAVEALGQHPDPSAIGPILKLRNNIPAYDSHLLHMVRMALRDQFKNPQTWTALARADISDTDCLMIADVLLSVPNRSCSDFLLAHMSTLKKDGRFLKFVQHMARFGNEETLTKLQQESNNTPANFQGRLLENIHLGLQEKGAQVPNNVTQWANTTAKDLVNGPDRARKLQGIQLIQQYRLVSLHEPVEKILKANGSQEERLEAAQALLAIDPEQYIPRVSAVISKAQEPTSLRGGLIGALAKTNQTSARKEMTQLMKLVDATLQQKLAEELAGSKQGGEMLLDALDKGIASRRLIQSKTVQDKLRQAKIPEIEAKLAKLSLGLPSPNALLIKAMQQHRDAFPKAKGDPAEGAKIFQKNCAVCHSLANEGGKIAPQLDGVGVRGHARLLEDILDPNRNVDQAFRATVLTLKNGQVITGLLVRKDGQILVMADGQGKEQRIAESDVEEQIVSPLSPMPANFSEALPNQDLYNLLAYLLEHQTKKQ